jgi:hypothetical protein
MTYISVFVALTLVFSFGLHSIETQHSHPGHSDQHGPNTHGHDGTKLTLGEYVHMTEKKLLYILFGLLSTGIILVRPLWYTWTSFLTTIAVTRTAFLRYLWSIRHLIVDYLTVQFSRGILNPQPH